MARAQTAVNALSSAAQLPKVIQDLGDQTKRMETEYQTLLELVEVQREVAIRLCSSLSHTPQVVPLEQWRHREEAIRDQVIRERSARKG